MKQVSKTNQKAFTLIELLVVIAILGVLAAGVLTAINPVKRINQANDSRIQSDLGQIVQALQAYYTSNKGQYPAGTSTLTTTNDLKVLPVPPGGGSYTYSVASGNTEASISFKVQDVAPGGTLWCWTSKAGQLTSAGSCTP